MQGRHGNSRVELEAKKSIVAAFDAMPLADDEKREKLWNVVKAGEAVLKEEVIPTSAGNDSSGQIEVIS